MNERTCRYLFVKAKGIGPVKAKALMGHLGSAKEVIKADPLSLTAAMEEIFRMTDGRVRFQKADIETIHDLYQTYDQAERELLAYRNRGISFLTEEDSCYPQNLRTIYDPPAGLFIKGSLPDGDTPCAAIVGSRDASPYGLFMAHRLAYELSSRGICVVSGMAKGIDAAAHEGAIKAQRLGLCTAKTIAVLGSGADVCYPSENRGVYDCMAAGEGSILSSFIPGTKPLACNFPVRNRIISGIASCVIVVEAKIRSGSLITADQALEQGRDVYALPGRVDDENSRGCNELIRQGAGIITDPCYFAMELEKRLFEKYSA